MSSKTTMKLPCSPPSPGDRPQTERIRIQTDDFSVQAEIEKLKAISPRIGGIVSFLGTARDFSSGRTVRQIAFEHYPGMAELRLAALRDQALQRFDIFDVTLIHRVGCLAPGENIVLVVVAAAHRQDAFAACRWCIDELKRTAPIWKKETTPEGDTWVEAHP